MAAETILHSGSFLDRDDNEVIVTFYRRTDLNVVPSSLTFGESGGTLTLECWSRTGEVRLTDYGLEEWLNYRQVKVEPIVGTEYHKYTYDIDCWTNPGDSRTTTLRVMIEYGQGVSEHVDIPVAQFGENNLTVSPASITFMPNGGTNGLTITWVAGEEPSVVLEYVQGDPGWIDVHNPIVTEGRKEQAFTAETNDTGSSRTAKITVTNGYNTELIQVSQSSL